MTNSAYHCFDMSLSLVWNLRAVGGNEGLVMFREAIHPFQRVSQDQRIHEQGLFLGDDRSRAPLTRWIPEGSFMTVMIGDRGQIL